MAYGEAMNKAMSTARRTEAQLEDSLVALFADRPELCGFTLALDGALVASNVGVFPSTSAEGLKVLCDEIRATLEELMDERPEARSLLAGRTFARRLH